VRVSVCSFPTTLLTVAISWFEAPGSITIPCPFWNHCPDLTDRLGSAAPTPLT
jgi:hypothetical protein